MPIDLFFDELAVNMNWNFDLKTIEIGFRSVPQYFYYNKLVTDL